MPWLLSVVAQEMGTEMGTTLNRSAYEKLIAENIEWLLKQPRTLERDHIEAIVRRSADHEYALTEAVRSDTTLLDSFDKLNATVYFTTNDWRGKKESGWAYWTMYGPEGPELYPTVRAAMTACIADTETEKRTDMNSVLPK